MPGNFHLHTDMLRSEKGAVYCQCSYFCLPKNAFVNFPRFSKDKIIRFGRSVLLIIG